MSEQTTHESVGGAKTRPTFLTVLCVLSWIAQGLGIFGLLTLTIFAGVGSAALGSLEGVDGVAVASEMGSIWLYLGLGIAMVIVGFIGVLKMWKLQKQGFFLYVGASVAGIIIDLTLSGVGLNMMSILFSALFIVLYGLNLKHME
jgi:hypothetical protein